MSRLPVSVQLRTNRILPGKQGESFMEPRSRRMASSKNVFRRTYEQFTL